MLRWRWNEIIGELEYEDFTKRMYLGNCLAVMGQLAYADCFGNKYDEPLWTVYAEYWDDDKDLKERLKAGMYDDVKRVRVNSYYKDKAMQIARAFARIRKTVEIYYEEPNNEHD